RREEKIAIEGAAVLTERRFLVEHPKRRPLRARLQSPTDVRDRVDLGISEELHIGSQELGVEATLDGADIAVGGGELDRRTDIVLERKYDVAGVDDDLALGRALVRPGDEEPARPVVPAAGLVGKAVFGNDGIAAERALQARAGLGRDRHAFGALEALLRRQ